MLFGRWPTAVCQASANRFRDDSHTRCSDDWRRWQATKSTYVYTHQLAVILNASNIFHPQLVPRWHKLIGLAPEWKPLKPEISMCTSIMDPSHVQAIATAKRNASSLHAIHTSNMLCPQQGLFVKLLPDERYIQLGSHVDDCTMFVVHLELRSLRGLLPGIGADDDQFHMKYMLFGSPSEARQLIPATVAGHFSIQEKITIQFRASIDSVREYFARIFYVPIDICDRTGAAIGHARFAITIPPLHDRSAEPLDGHVYSIADRTFVTLAHHQDAAERPWIDYEFAIRLLHPPKPCSGRLASETELLSEITDGNTASSSASDPIESAAAVDCAAPGDSTNDIVEPINAYRPPSHLTEPDSVKPATPLLSSRPPSAVGRTNANTFSYRLHLQQVRFTRKADVGIWQVSLHHPKAHTPVALVNISVRAHAQDATAATSCAGTTTTIDNVSVELLFSFESTGIRTVIASEPCVLNIKGPHAMFATAELDNATLLAQPAGSVGIILMENEACEKVAIANAYVELTDLGANLNAQQPKFRRFAQPSSVASGRGGAAGDGVGLRPHLDEELAYKMVEELEQWKTAQQEEFLVELKRREVQHLARLTGEWTLRRGELESMLTQKLDQCAVLTKALEEANMNVKVSLTTDCHKGTIYTQSVFLDQKNHQHEDLDRQRLLDQVKAELEKSCKRRLQQLQEQARRCEDDAAYDAKLAELRYKELQLKFDQLQLEHSQCSNPSRSLLKNDIAQRRQQSRRNAADVESNTDDGETTDFSITHLIASEKDALQREQDELQTITQTLEQQRITEKRS